MSAWMNATHAWISSVSKRSKLSEPPGKCCTAAAAAVRRMSESCSSPLASADGPPSSTSGVSAPLCLLVGCPGKTPLVPSSDGECDRGGERLLVLPFEPWVAMTEGEEGGSGDLVK